MRIYAITLISILGLYGCSTVHNSSITPPKNFDNGNQISTSGSLGSSGYNLSLAYSPIKGVFVHGLLNNTIDFDWGHHNSYTYGLGGYINIENITIEAEIGTGNGKFEWYSFPGSGSYYSLEHARGFYNKKYLNVSLIFNQNFGLTLDLGKLHTRYTYIESPFERFYDFNSNYPNKYIGGSMFFKFKLASKLKLHLIGGIRIHQDMLPYPSLIQAGIGLNYRFNLSNIN
ncbi:MAG: hypothetical protein ACPGVD_04375 [Flavobacteriales bacterium]